AGNVILFAPLNQHAVQIPDRGAGSKTILMEQLVPPIDLFAASALAYAPFPLPKVPARVNQAWLFKSGSGELPTIPVLALHHFAAPAFIDLQHELAKQASLSDSGAGVTGTDPEPDPGSLSSIVRRIRQTIQAHPEFLPNSRPGKFYPALKAFYQGPDSCYIDFYGPPQTIATIPYYQVIRAKESNGYPSTGFDFKGKAVFVGNSEQYQPDLKDDFHTVFSQDSGFDLSGVEIMATVFANLLEGRSIRPVPRIYEFSLIVLWGLLIGVFFYLTPGFATIASAILSALLYLTIAATWFETKGVWIPLVNPLLCQLPLALFAALLLRYRSTHRKSRRIQQTAGYFLPREVIDLLPEWKREDLVDAGRIVEGVCLASDAESFATFAENIEPRELKNRLNSYYDLLFQPIRDRGGTILDVVGDAMLAFWETKSCPINSRLQACHAAMEIQTRISASRGCNLEFSILPTRIGLHAGKMIIGNVGAGDHFEFRAVGDMINTTSRIEGLNKHLGTRILASAQVANKLDGVVIRRTGKFRLKGKENHLEIFELVCRSEDCQRDFLDLREIFLGGLDKYEAGRWREARSVFETIIKQYGNDGPSQFYLRVCDEYSKNGPPQPWDGVYTLKVK
ncbi:MAG: CHASE2 domain-containing protein, partial [Methylococcales bacterium]